MKIGEKLMGIHLKSVLLALIGTFAMLPGSVHAQVALVDHDGWKVNLSGFVEMDSFFDTTRSFTEVVGNNPVARPGTLSGETGRTQLTLRNTRFAFNVIPPTVEDWKTRGYLEMDFLGYDPSVSTSQSESAFYSNPSLRIRH